VFDVVDEIVNSAYVVCFGSAHGVLKEVEGGVVVLAESEPVLHPLHVLAVVEFGDTYDDSIQQGQNQEPAVAPQNLEGLVADFVELFLVDAVLALHQKLEIGRPKELTVLAFDPELPLEVAQEVAEVDVEEAAVVLHHHVARVAVCDAQDPGQDALARAAAREVAQDALVVLGVLLVLLEEVVLKQVVLGAVDCTPVCGREDLREIQTVGHDLNEAFLVAGGLHRVGVQLQVEPALHRHLVDELVDTQHNQVLAQVVAGLLDEQGGPRLLLPVHQRDQHGLLLAAQNAAFVDVDPLELVLVLARQTESRVLRLCLQLLVDLVQLELLFGFFLALGASVIVVDHPRCQSLKYFHDFGFLDVVAFFKGVSVVLQIEFCFFD